MSHGITAVSPVPLHLLLSLTVTPWLEVVFAFTGEETELQADMDERLSGMGTQARLSNFRSHAISSTHAFSPL